MPEDRGDGEADVVYLFSSSDLPASLEAVFPWPFGLSAYDPAWGAWFQQTALLHHLQDFPLPLFEADCLGFDGAVLVCSPFSPIIGVLVVGVVLLLVEVSGHCFSNMPLGGEAGD
eukprot:CAMPEP_0204183468 /NCGR_PEP_ID=MMETSP0361-20130328/53632_1 /ASSEMBLY_ACC=CAM_ASM_000343 /TAXON_ID=268821 /ORGANISM="Scrippsiella Hangoei, Strain SHTV-5" /LENGTH=114 /DNA_ID=CAMNT_0051143361 /DNA_START=242 /DNA_END=587 /DNA_ORIENTATION=+